MRMVNKALPAVLSTAMATSLCVGTFAVPVSAAESSDTKCRLTYDSQGGDPLQARTYDKGSVVDLIPQATRSGYAFLGWYNGTGANAAEVTSATMNTDKTVYARWEVSTENTLHTTVFDINMPNKDYDVQTTTGDAKVVLPQLTVADAVEGYNLMTDAQKATYSLDFNGWKVETDDGITIADDTASGAALVTEDFVATKDQTLTPDYTVKIRAAGDSERTSIANATVTVNPSSYIFDGQEKKPEITVKLNNTTLTKGADYTVSYVDNLNPGTASVMITGIGAYKGTTTASFTIADNTADLANAEVTVDPGKFSYDGTEKRPTVTVKMGTHTLTENTDYTLVYSNNVEVGEATVTVSGMGHYAGSKSKTFEIEESNIKSLKNARVLCNPLVYTYDGKAHEPEVTVKMGDKVLVKDTDYTVAYSNNVEIGNATVTVTGMGSYASTQTGTFKIVKADVATNSLELASVAVTEDNFVYDGTAKTPGVAVIMDGKLLVQDKDYTVTYANNTEIGKGTVSVTGIGDYTGTNSVEFSIKSSRTAINEASVGLSQKSYVYDGKEKKPDVSVILSGLTLKEGRDYTVEYENNTKIGKATVTVTGMGNYEGKATATFLITNEDGTLDGAETSTDNDTDDTTITLSIDGRQITVQNPTKHTLEELFVKLQASGVVTATGTPAKYTIKTLTKQATDISKDTTIAKLASYAKDGKALVCAYDANGNGIGSALIKNSGDHSYKVSLSTKTDIDLATADIAKISIENGTVTLDKTEYTYDGNAKTPGVTVTVNGKTLTKETDYTVAYANNVEIGKGTVTITGTGDYEGTLKKEFTIKKASSSDTSSDNDEDDTTGSNNNSSSSSSSSNAAENDDTAISLTIRTLAGSSKTVTIQNPTKHTLSEVYDTLRSGNVITSDKEVAKFTIQSAGSSGATEISSSATIAKVASYAKGSKALLCAYDSDGNAIGSALITSTGSYSYMVSLSKSVDSSLLNSKTASDGSGTSSEGKSDSSSASPEGKENTTAASVQTADADATPVVAGMGSLLSGCLGIFSTIRKRFFI